MVAFATAIRGSGMIFVSHASEDKALADDFIDLLDTGMGVRRADVFCSSVPGHGIPLGDDFRAYLLDRLKAVDLVIFLVTAQFLNSRFAMCEMGAAWALGKTVIPLLLPPLKAPDMQEVFGNRHLGSLADPVALDGLRDRVPVAGEERPSTAVWTAKRTEFGVRAGNHLPSVETEQVMQRGQPFDYMIDAALYVPSVTPDIHRAIVDDLRSARVLSTDYCYLAESGFRHWLDLTNDPQYTYYRESLRFFGSHAEDIAREIRSALNDQAVDYVSLGPGDGRKDRAILNSLSSGGRATDTYYYPIDINANMIAAAARTVLSDRVASNAPRIKGVAANFARLAAFKPVYQFRPAPNVMSLLGNTLGNMENERRFLGELFDSAMLAGDVLVLEVKTRPDPGRSTDDPESALVTIGNIELNKRFDFGPLELIGVGFDPSRLSYQSAFGLSSIANTETTVAMYEHVEHRGERFRNCKLSYIHSYDSSEMERLLRAVGFKLLRSYINNGFAVFILQKPPGRPN